MASFSVINEGCERQMNVEARSFSSFLTEDMLDAAMNNIQVMQDSDNEDTMYVDDETSGISSNGEGSLGAEVILEEHLDEDQHCSKKTDVLNLNASYKPVQNERGLVTNFKDPIVSENMCLNTTSAMQLHLEETSKLTNGSTAEEEPTKGINLLKDIEHQEKAINIEEKLLTIEDDINKDENTCTEINTIKDVNNQLNGTEQNTIKDVDNQLSGTEKNTNVESTTLKNLNVHINEINTKIDLTKHNDGKVIYKGNNSNIEISNKADEMKLTEERSEKDIALTAVSTGRQSNIPEDIHNADTTSLTKEKDYSNNTLDGSNDQIIISIKEAFSKIKTMREKRIIDKVLTVETANHTDASFVTESATNENIMTLTNKQDKLVKLDADKPNLKMPELKIVKHSFKENDMCHEKTQPNLVHSNGIENSLEQNNLNVDEIMMDYEEISDDDDDGLEIDDNLEKEIENNLIAEIGLSPQSKKTCFVLDDPEMVDDVEDSDGIEKAEAQKSTNESITLYRADGTETADVSSMVECVLDSNAIGTSPSGSDLIPNTSYSESCDVIMQAPSESNESKQIKVIYMKENQKSEVVKQLIPVLKKPTSLNKNVQYLLKLHGNVKTDNVANKKLKLVPVHTSLLRKKGSTVNHVAIKEPSFQEMDLKKQIVESQLPPYKSSLVVTSSVFRCEECQDRFLVQSSLKHHINRRSIVITYWCRICCFNIQFYNRCLMLKHIRSHRQHVTNIDPSSVEVKPIAKEMLELGLPKSITQDWEENSVKKIFSKYSITDSQTGRKESILIKPNTLTTVVKIPRINNNQFVPLSSLNTVSTTSNIDVHQSNKDKNIQSESVQVTNQEINLETQSMSVKNSNNKTSKYLEPTHHNSTSNENVYNQALSPNFGTIDVELNTIESQTNNESNFDTELCSYSQSAETPSEIRIDEVYSMNVSETSTAEEQDLNSAVAETVIGFKSLLGEKTEERIPRISVTDFKSLLGEKTEERIPRISVTDFKSLLGEKTEERIPRISVKALPIVENDFPTDCKIISMSNKNGMVNNKKMYTQDKGKGIRLKSVNTLKTNITDQFVFCSECGIKVVDMERHLSRSNQPTDHNLTCRVCRLILPTKCSLKIHLRVHMKLPPYKCPECGKQFNVFEKLFSHIRFVCGHLSRLVKYICSKCRKPCSNLVQLESHIFTSHTNRVFKCSKCPVAFFNISSVKKHKSKEHPTLDIVPLTYQQCTLCPDLIPKGKVSEHISKHARNPSQLAYVYHCPGCKKWYTNNKAGFVLHLKKCEKVLNQLKKYNNELTAVSDKSKNEDVCSGDSDSFTEENSIERKSLHLDDEDVIEMSEKDPLSLEDWEAKVEQHVIEKRIEMCIVCKEEPVIILPGTDLNKQSLCCNLCVKPVDIESLQNKSSSNKFKVKTNLKLKTHQQAKSKISNETIHKRKRSSRPIKRKINVDFEYDTVDYPLVNQSSEKSDSTCSSPENKKLPKNKIRFKKSKIDSSPDECGINFVSGQIIPENQSTNVFCTKCGFKANDVDEFRNHVVTHRTDPNAYQCLECGLCFVVRPSLEKHLIVLHGIKNVEAYIQNNDVGGGHIVKVEQEEDTDSRDDEVKENQCRVCYLMCDSSTSLDKHFRTHGMAFLMSSQRQSKKL